MASADRWGWAATRCRPRNEPGVGLLIRSVARTHDKPVARIPYTRDENAHNEAGCGAERLTTTNAQRVHNQLLLGPSFQQGWAVEATDRQWFEESVEEERNTTATACAGAVARNVKRRQPKKFQQGKRAREIIPC